MKNKVNITDRSIESAGIPKDYKEALSELIWNGYDAGASQVEILFDANEIEHVNQLTVKDNGSGIDYRNLPMTFGTLLDSVKKVSYQRSSYVHGQKGKGRFSFTTFARHATWHTVVNPEGKAYAYSIAIASNNKDEYNSTELKEVKAETPTGTEVILTNLFGVTGSSFTSQAFHEFLCQEFGWFLFLNRKNQFSLLINGEELNYSNIIAEYDVKAVILDEEDKSYSFDLTFIRWKTRIGDRYYYYFLNQKKREAAKLLTSFNNNAIDFHHSIYVESDFFNDFSLDRNDPGSRLIGKNQSHPVYRELLRELNTYLSKKEQMFIHREAADRLLREYQVLGILPTFSGNRLEQEKSQQLENLIKEIYAIQPKIFKSLRKEQQKLFVNMLSIVMESQDRTRLVDVIDSVSDMDEETRHSLRAMLEKDDLFQANQSVKLIEDRNTAITLLQHFSDSDVLFESEKEEIGKIMAENTWMLGESHSMTSPNISSVNFLRESLTILDGKKKARSKKAPEVPFYQTRPDVFVCRKKLLASPAKGPYGTEENILVDIKRPGYTLSQADHRQASAYLRYVIKDPQQNGGEQSWKFFLIADAADVYITEQYASYLNKGKPYLIQSQRNFEIYALCWKDIFNNYAQAHSYFLSRQKVDRAILDQALWDKGIKL
jgi:hypothetical protein